MTREEAINILWMYDVNFEPHPAEEVMHAIDMAIEALRQPEIVRCKDCKYQDKGENESESQNLCGYRPWLYVPVTDDHFCGYAVRKDGD